MCVSHFWKTVHTNWVSMFVLENQESVSVFYRSSGNFKVEQKLMIIVLREIGRQKHFI
jgi:hypothetical protein